LNLLRLATKIRAKVGIECNTIIAQDGDHYLIEVQAFHPGMPMLTIQHREALKTLESSRADMENVISDYIGSQLWSVINSHLSE